MSQDGDTRVVDKILITGFEPYGGLVFNPTEFILDELAAYQDTGVETALLPTSYNRAESEIAELIQRQRPTALLMLGLKRRATRLCFERLADNLDNSIAPDNDGHVRIRKKIIDGAPKQYSNTLPFDILADAAVQMGETVEFSDDAGGYVCNHAYFVAANTITTNFPNCPYAFVHVPPLRRSSNRMARIVKIIRCWTRLLQSNPHTL